VGEADAAKKLEPFPLLQEHDRACVSTAVVRRCRVGRKTQPILSQLQTLIYRFRSVKKQVPAVL